MRPDYRGFIVASATNPKQIAEDDSVPQFKMATVTSVSPLRVRYDNELSASPATPRNLVGTLAIGDRVRVTLHRRKIAIDGRIGGMPYDTLALSSLFVNGTPTQTPTAVRDGRWVQMEGAWQMDAGTSPVTPAVPYNAATTLFTLPAGWRPAKLLTFPSGAFGATVQMTADVRVDTTGVVSVYVNNAGSVSTGAHFSLNAVRYRL